MGKGGKGGGGRREEEKGEGEGERGRGRRRGEGVGDENFTTRHYRSQCLTVSEAPICANSSYN